MYKALQEKHNKYLELIKSTQDCHGFIQSDQCDSLLFSGLLGCVHYIKVDIDVAFDPIDEQWKRRPKDCSCYPVGSASSISRDMLIGLAWYTWYNKRLDISEQIIKYALSHWLLMGEAKTWKDKISRCLLTPGLLATWAEISYRLGGPNRWWLRYIPQFESKSVTGFQAHLSVLHCMLRKELTGKINEVVYYHAKREQNNPLFQIAIEDYDSALLILMDSRLWPEQTLPTSANRKDFWLPQRDFGIDWKPTSSNPPKVHSGGDFLFCSYLILKKIRDE